MGLLRFLLALSVLIDHSSPIFGLKLISGELAVLSFFIISGFYMSLILNEKYINENSSYKLFVSNRLLRILPLYWIILLLTTFLFLISLLRGNPIGILQLYFLHFQNGSLGLETMWLLIITQIFLIGQELWVFFSISFSDVDANFRAVPLYKFLFVPQAWTLSLEILFYLIAPFILKRRLASTLLLISLSVALRFFALYFFPGYDTYRFFPIAIFYFLLGRISYYIFSMIELASEMILVGIRYFLIFLIISYQFVLDFQGKDFLFLGILVMLIPFLFLSTQNSKFDRYLGELSFPVYISHMLLNFIIDSKNVPKFESLGTTLAISTIIFSIILYETIVKRIENVRQRRVSDFSSSKSMSYQNNDTELSRHDR